MNFRIFETILLNLDMTEKVYYKGEMMTTKFAILILVYCLSSQQASSMDDDDKEPYYAECCSKQIKFHDFSRLSTSSVHNIGIAFFDILNAKANYKKRSWAPDSPEWRYHTDGSNLIGVCKEKSCKAYKKEVVSQLGYGTFYIAKAGIVSIDAKCPICKTRIIPKTSSFNMCYFRMSAKKFTKETWNSGWEKHDDPTGLIFCDDTENSTIFSDIKIECRKLSDIPADFNDSF